MTAGSGGFVPTGPGGLGPVVRVGIGFAKSDLVGSDLMGLTGHAIRVWFGSTGLDLVGTIGSARSGRLRPYGSYPGPWKVLRKLNNRYVCLHEQEVMPSLKEVALDILTST
ncbi:hypothetical protein GIB67_011697 [Kingdonia uniflora]|uniref:DUF1995 domain-containing protein n=1 Tax=Kingdonia uniflora TaxID=39325 RepID=A0A7J7LUA9_9MAGN|nr:hypothetical protein GIB67_011697 [Kingdonia uniflora]